MYAWIRRVTPDLFLAAVVALLITLALNHMEKVETRRMGAEAAVAAADGFSLDERISVVGSSIRRATRVYIPILVALGGAVVGLVCRLRRWAWLTALLAIIPAILTGGSFYIDVPSWALIITCTYVGIAALSAVLLVQLRGRLAAARAPADR
jgi:hypothetical protein